MTDFYKEMLQKSINRQAKEIVSEGATEHDRYGHLLDAFNGRDLEQEERDRKNAMISNLAESGKAVREQREREAKESQRMIENALWNARNADRKAADDYMNKYKERLDKAKETIQKRQDKYFK